MPVRPLRRWKRGMAPPGRVHNDPHFDRWMVLPRDQFEGQAQLERHPMLRTMTETSEGWFCQCSAGSSMRIEYR